MINRAEITGIILAGGRGRRLGEEKGLCTFNKKPLVEYAIEVLKPVCGNILISANNNLDQYKKYGFPVVTDEIKDAGPLGGIMTCLKRSVTRHNLVLSCDTPFVETSIFIELLKQIKNYQVVAPSHETFLVEPLCAYYATNVLSEIESAIDKGEFKMMNLLKRVRFKSVPFDNNSAFLSGVTFLNINYREDLLKAEKVIKEKHYG